MSKKIMISILATLLAVSLIVGVVLADSGYPNPSDFNGKGCTGDADKSVTNFIGAILTIARIIGVGVAVIMLIVLAIKYIAAAPGDKAEIKKHAVVYVVGAVVLFAASGILHIIQLFATNVAGDGGSGANPSGGGGSTSGSGIRSQEGKDVYYTME